MRNSEARRYARWSAAVATLLALVVAGVYVRGVFVARQAEKKAPPAVPATIEQRSNEFSFSKVEGQRTIYTVRASRTTEFKEGNRNLLEDVSIIVYGKKGERNDTLRTRACDFIASTGKIGCEGDVQISLQAHGTSPASARALQVVTSGVSFERDTGHVPLAGRRGPRRRRAVRFERRHVTPGPRRRNGFDGQFARAPTEGNPRFG
jgi:hypothetical protein